MEGVILKFFRKFPEYSKIPQYSNNIPMEISVWRRVSTNTILLSNNSTILHINQLLQNICFHLFIISSFVFLLPFYCLLFFIFTNLDHNHLLQLTKIGQKRNFFSTICSTKPRSRHKKAPIALRVALSNYSPIRLFAAPAAYHYIN